MSKLDELLSTCQDAVSLEGTQSEASRYELFWLVRELALESVSGRPKVRPNPLLLLQAGT
jgi:hypothetical protein